jgi:flagellar basal body-associated protein FliL
MKTEQEYRTVIKKKTVQTKPNNSNPTPKKNKSEIIALVVLVALIYCGLAVLIYSITHGYKSFPNH